MTQDLDALTGRVRGPVLRPGDDGYDGELAGFQAAARQRPAVIVGATGADDVCAAVRYAADHGLPVAVQATGHGLAIRDTGEGLLITTRRMTGVRVEPGPRTAWIEAGARWSDVIGPAAGHGLAPRSGSSPDVGAVAYTLGGGIGLLSRQFGYAADHVRRIELVTADGRLRRVGADTEPDLFWALRGGRDGLGVVTGLEVDLVPVSRLYGGGLFFDGGDGERAVDVLNAYRRWADTVPEEMSSSVGLIPFPDVPGVPGPLRGRFAAHVRIAYTGDAATGAKLVEPLRAVGPRLIDKLGDLPFTAAGSIHNEPNQPHGYSGTNAFLTGFDAAAAGTVLELAGPQAPVPCVVELRHLGGALARPPAVANAVGHRDARYLLRALSAIDPHGIDAVVAAHERLFTAMKPWSTGGTCLNFLYGDRPADQVRAAFEPADLARLTRIRRGYDPAGMFARA